MSWLPYAIIGGLALLFGAFFRGAPYVPTHRRQVEAALDLLNLKAGSTVVDLGSGDGVFLKAAAKRGLAAYGYEINPVLCWVAKLRCWAFRTQVHVLWRDFWLTDFPEQTDAVFVFLNSLYMPKLHRRLVVEQKRLNKPLYVVSYGFTIPHKKLIKTAHGLNLYKYE